MTREELVLGLRKAADIFEQHPELPMPLLGVDISMYVCTREDMATIMRALGGADKSMDDYHFKVTRTLAGSMSYGVNICAVAYREAVCTRRVVATTTILAKPARTVELPAEPEKVIEKVEWECPDSILAPADQASELREMVAAQPAGAQS
jgi:hypothetical protein